MHDDPIRTRILDAAEQLFYSQGIQTVGMDAVRTAAGVTLRRLYQQFPSKGVLVEEYLRRRDARWRGELEEYVEAADASARERVLAVFDWLHIWFEQPDFRGCAFINSFGELGATSPEVTEAARHHKERFRHFVVDLVRRAGAPSEVADHVVLLAEGAMTTAAISGDPQSAARGRAAAAVLLQSARVG
ncbi:AcrR family transcriptional regulator [Streptomyces griseochromogenes]|uniref:AcrR family transcriptional regulator n=1 Tax=Streptomyces griseochromogenes TaxID=68214 RepID=A0A1B1BDF4_9ACTN|nr:TetR/AcrR family transcriptional regulator [Streptomyces griseochromogenes]ANP56779.1 TetR family transcriptional regulator [Streptomyces griseochromogenes]MBP2056247.1 AcrR family transcriptional regulator [Streptomyces griseochromogenes]